MSTARIDRGPGADGHRIATAAADGTATPLEGRLDGPVDGPVDGPTVGLDFLQPNGLPGRSPARPGPDRDGGRGVRVREVVLAGEWPMIQRRLAGPAAASPAAREALEREVSAALRLGQAAGGPGPFAELVGYDVDVSEPFVLYRPPRGRPLAEVAGVLPLTEWRRVGAGLVSALRLYEQAGLAHADLMPDSVHWDGDDIQLGPPRSAASIGSPRRAAGSAPWASPEARAGGGAVDIRDDLWSAAQLLYYLLGGQPGPADGPPADLALKPVFQPVLRALFAPFAVDRPSTVDVLRAMSWPERAGRGDPGLDPLAEGRRAFEAARDRKRLIRDPSYRPPGTPAGPDHRAGDEFEPMPPNGPPDRPPARRRGWLGRR